MIVPNLFYSTVLESVWIYDCDLHFTCTYAIAASKRRRETHQCSRDNGHLDSTTKLSCSHGDVWQHPHSDNADPIRPRQHFGGNRLRVRVSFIFIMHTCNMQRQGVGNKWKVLSKVIMLCCCFCKLFCGFFYEKKM